MMEDISSGVALSRAWGGGFGVTGGRVAAHAWGDGRSRLCRVRKAATTVWERVRRQWGVWRRVLASWRDYTLRTKQRRGRTQQLARTGHYRCFSSNELVKGTTCSVLGPRGLITHPHTMHARAARGQRTACTHQLMPPSPHTQSTHSCLQPVRMMDDFKVL